VKKIDTNSWKPFPIGSLFDQLKLKKKKQGFSKRADTSLEKTEEFCLPLVNAKHGNNGIMFYGRPSDFESAEMTLDIVQNGAIATGDVYAQIQATGVLWDAYLVRPKHKVSALALLFLACAVERAIKNRFNYDDKAVWKKVRTVAVPLPVTKENEDEPDYAYMESFMRERETAVRVALDALQSTVGVESGTGSAEG
jgi:hypothetical protein